MGLNLNGHLGSASPCINSLDVTKDSLHRESVIKSVWKAYAGAFYCLAHLLYQFLHGRYVPQTWNSSLRTVDTRKLLTEVVRMYQFWSKTRTIQHAFSERYALKKNA